MRARILGPHLDHPRARIAVSRPCHATAWNERKPTGVTSRNHAGSGSREAQWKPRQTSQARCRGFESHRPLYGKAPLVRGFRCSGEIRRAVAH